MRWRDTVRLENNVAGDVLTGGTWVQAGITAVTPDGETYARYSYQIGDQTLATASIDTDFDVVLV